MILKTDLHFSIDLITDILSYFFMGDFKYKKIMILKTEIYSHFSIDLI